LLRKRRADKDQKKIEIICGAARVRVLAVVKAKHSRSCQCKKLLQYVGGGEGWQIYDKPGSVHLTVDGLRDLGGLGS
jgi:hypothetical protein